MAKNILPIITITIIKVGGDDPGNKEVERMNAAKMLVINHEKVIYIIEDLYEVSEFEYVIGDTRIHPIKKGGEVYIRLFRLNP